MVQYKTLTLLILTEDTQILRRSKRFSHFGLNLANSLKGVVSIPGLSCSRYRLYKPLDLRADMIIVIQYSGIGLICL